MSSTTEPKGGAEDPNYEVEVVRDVRIPTTDPKATLSADLYLPVDADPVPALVKVLPYRKDGLAGIAYDASLRWFAQRGYACLHVDFRGTGLSDGTMRPPFDPDEADDAVAAIVWAAAQPWCDGNVGMWGLSYPALMSLRTATRPPPQLKAIVPVMGALDLERDFVHPDGSPGLLAPMHWGVQNLAMQLLPPLHNHHSAEEQRRWRQRLHEAEPYIVDLVRHGRQDPAWRERGIDASGITVPTLCVGGWRDPFCQTMVRAYEEIAAPKKLLVGPWMHTLPHDSPFGAIGFLSLALRWWDHWLRGIDNGVMDEPHVTVYVQGSNPGWRAYESWPPAKTELLLATGDNTTLIEPTSDDAGGTAVIGEYVPDPTTGALSGLWGIPTAGFGLPLDQHDDDSRALAATSEPLGKGLLFAGRPEVIVRLTGEYLAGGAVERIVVRLADVDPRGRSTFITAGLVCPAETREVRVLLWPIAYRISAGHRLRVVVSDADFPRLWPLTGAASLHVAGIELFAPTVPEDLGAAISLPRVDEPAPDAAVYGLWDEPRWQITRDPIHDGIEVVVGYASEAFTPNEEHRLGWRTEARATVRRDEPDAAVFHAADAYVVRMNTGETIEATATARVSRAALWARGEVSIDGTIIFSRVWEAQPS